MHYFSYKKQKRYRAIENAIRDFEDLLDKNDTDNGFINKQQSAAYRDLIDNLTIPNVRSGILEIGKRALQQENYIPIWTVHTGEKFRIKTKHTLPTVAQMAVTANHLDSDQQQLYTNMRHHSPPLPLNIGTMPDVTAMVTESLFSVPHKDGEYRGMEMSGRPRILLNGNYIEKATRPDILAHELQHVHQCMTKPVNNCATLGNIEDRILVSEIEAYGHQKVIIDEMLRQDRWDESCDDIFDDVEYINCIMNVVLETTENIDEGTSLINKVRKGLAAASLNLSVEDFYSEKKRRHLVPPAKYSHVDV